MTCSMTAFARKERPTEFGILSCEIKTVNHRYLDVSVRTAEPARKSEPDIVKKVRGRLARGRVECFFNVQRNDTGATPGVNMQALAALAEEMHKTRDKLHDAKIETTPVSVIEVMKWPGIINADEPDAERMHESVMQLLDTTLDDLIDGRREEGMRLQEFILEHCGQLEKIIAQLRERYPQALAEMREKLNRRLAEMNLEIDPERLAQEAALLAQKFYIGADITEEIDRCASHTQELKAVFKRKEPIGRRLDFLMQELNREVNTISSKSADIATTHSMVETKVLIEKMREQIQNIE